MPSTTNSPSSNIDQLDNIGVCERFVTRSTCIVGDMLVGISWGGYRHNIHEATLL